MHAASSFTEILIDADLFSKSDEGILIESAQEILDDMSKNGVDLANLSLSDLGMFANPASNMKLLTLHSAKGREFDAVAIIDLHDGQLPHRSATSFESLAAYTRLFYVGVTRARKLLMYVTDSENARNQPSRFLGASGLRLTPQ